ncbi:lactoylglutathione lyase [Halarchaeum acidiphilum MH1-52-1]|uniref:Lactoylglutathione lyase n=2 Tax=Halarchaeum acidiphilum TaxID=489138 RepID=U2YV00_9EURY|nr:VOC family protein [Halarchaeum acidiphilum]GAD52835.1 lactoylglutathione lyase [Halarchaeum acidiphilum MH1-52-1]
MNADLLHVCLNVADVDASVAWYVEQLGFEETWGFESGETANRYVADQAGIELQLSETEGVTPTDDGDRWDHLAVGVEDVDRAFDEIENHGVVQKPADNDAAGARTAFIEDPDGHVVELVQPLD